MDAELEFPKRTFVMYTRKTIYLGLLACLLVPVFLVAGFGVMMGVSSIFVISLLSASMGTIAGWFLLQLWERKMQRSVAQIVQVRLEKMNHSPDSLSAPQAEKFDAEIQRLTEELEKTQASYDHQISHMQSMVTRSKEEVQHLHSEMDKKLEEMRVAYLEYEDLRKEYKRLEEEAVHHQEEWETVLENRESLINEYQRTVAEQRAIIEKKQHYISKLEMKVRDLMYEIRTILQIEAPIKDRHFDEMLDIEDEEGKRPLVHAPQTPYDYSVQLNRYIEKAEHLTGVDHLGFMGGKSPRFLDLSLDGYEVDKRRLFDSFKDETAGAVFIYAPHEKKFLFVNPAVKNLTGWSQEKFMKEFPRLVARGYPEWEEAMHKIKSMRECSLRLAILNRANQPRPFDCYLGMITKGPFSGHVIGLFST